MKAIEAAAAEQVADIARFDRNGAGDGEGRIEVGLGDADLRRLGGRLVFRRPDVGTATKQVSRHTDGDFGGHTRQALMLFHPGFDIARRLTDQHAHRIHRLGEGRLVLRNSGERRVVGSGRLVDVELGGGAALELDLGDAQALLLQCGVGAGDGDQALQFADGHIGRGDVAGQRHQDIVIGGDLIKQVGLGRLHIATQLAPDVDFPAGVETGAVGVEFVVDRNELADFLDQGVVGTELEAAVAEIALLLLRKQLAAGDSKLGARPDRCAHRPLPVRDCPGKLR